MKRTSLVVAVLVCISVLLVGSNFLPDVRATTLYVGGAGPGNYTTIQTAIDDANPGDTIHVYSGTYHENIIVNKTVSLVGEDRATTTIDGNGVGDVVYVTSDWTNISGFTIAYNGWQNDDGINLYSSSNCQIYNNNISSNSGNGINIDSSDHNTILNNTVTSNQSVSITLRDSNDSMLANNILNSNADVAVTLTFSTNSTIANNTMLRGGIFISGDLLDHWASHTIDTTNTVNGKPVYYSKNVVGGTVPLDVGQVILANCRSIIVEGANISGTVGIALGFSSETIITNNVLSHNGIGIFLQYSSNNSIMNNSINSNSMSGAMLHHSSENSITYNTISDSPSGLALYTDSNNNEIASNVLSNNDVGIESIWGMNNRATSNTLLGNSIAVFGWAGDINASGNYWGTVDERRIERMVFGEVDFSSPLLDEPNEVPLLRVADETWTGTVIVDRGTIVEGNLSLVDANVIFRNDEGENFIQVHGNLHAVRSTFSSESGKFSVVYINKSSGSFLDSSIMQARVLATQTDGMTVEECRLTLGHRGIAVLNGASHTRVANNTIAVNSGDGVYVMDSSNSTIIYNSIYLNNQNGIAIKSVEESSRDTIIAYNDISANDRGIYLAVSASDSSNNVISFNSVTENHWDGIQLTSSRYNTIVSNTIMSNGRVGIGAAGFVDTISSNDIVDNYYGVYIWGSYSTLRDNNFMGNTYGVYSSGSDNTLYQNNFMGNTYGVYLWSVDDALYHNNFLGNSFQAVDYAPWTSWDNGYPSGGNYWSDYAGNDQFSGPSQDQPGSDGIGDTPYLIDTDSQDEYPLMFPFGTTFPRPPEMREAILRGGDLENVTLTWSISPDDGMGLKSVVGYDIYRGIDYDSEGLGYGLVASLPNGTSTFTDSLAGEGNPNNYFYRVCAVDTYNNTTCATNQGAKFVRPLSTGPNLVSIPLIPSDDSIEHILQTVKYDKAWYYDSSSQEWKWFMKSKGYRRGLWNVNHTMGLWVNVTGDCNLTVAGIVPAQTMIHLHSGWNLVGFPSFNTTYTVADLKAETGATRVEGLETMPPFPPHFLRVLGDADMLLAGEAYWVKVDADTIWTVEVA